MQIERHDIGGGEATLRQIGQEEFVDHPVADEPDLPFLFLLGRSRVGGDNDAHEWSALVQPLVWAVVERTTDSPFRAAQMLISRQVQTSLDIGATRVGGSLSRGSHTQNRPGRRRLLRFHIGHRGAAGSDLRESPEP